MDIFNVNDVFKFAVRIEEDGELFYHKAALITDDEGVRNLFNNLADEEIRHKRIFSEMLEKIEPSRPKETYTGEYMMYLRDYIDGKAIFTKDQKNFVAEIHDTISAIDFAIKRELDSITYYQEVKNFVNEKYYSKIDAIIDEERKHFATLSEIKRKYLSKTTN